MKCADRAGNERNPPRLHLRRRARIPVPDRVQTPLRFSLARIGAIPPGAPANGASSRARMDSLPPCCGFRSRSSPRKRAAPYRAALLIYKACEASGDRPRLRLLARRPKAGEGEAREAERHHRPGRSLGNTGCRKERGEAGVRAVKTAVVEVHGDLVRVPLRQTLSSRSEEGNLQIVGRQKSKSRSGRSSRHRKWRLQSTPTFRAGRSHGSPGPQSTSRKWRSCRQTVACTRIHWSRTTCCRKRPDRNCPCRQFPSPKTSSL